MRIPLLLALALAASAAEKRSEPLRWVPDLKSAKVEAAKTGKPIFLVTIWKPGT